MIFLSSLREFDWIQFAWRSNHEQFRNSLDSLERIIFPISSNVPWLKFSSITSNWNEFFEYFNSPEEIPIACVLNHCIFFPSSSWSARLASQATRTNISKQSSFVINMTSVRSDRWFDLGVIGSCQLLMAIWLSKLTERSELTGWEFYRNKCFEFVILKQFK